MSDDNKKRYLLFHYFVKVVAVGNVLLKYFAQNLDHYFLRLREMRLSEGLSNSYLKIESQVFLHY